ncbi:hypothetical protein BJY04DRAFT_158553 [Aspergillus karnatakaensis]|uniref:uncharacterized protein n=1 Tax=Aspergillus karnatakaensis TaxID=1810916 RepID=UPI003CCDB122
MPQLPTPPVSRQTSESPDLNLPNGQTADLAQSLDSILEKYLHLLDKHQRLQGELAAKLSSGFISLAHANYTCPPGRRYGADYYDERMKATRRVILQSSSATDARKYNASSRGLPQTGMQSGQIFSFASASDVGEEEWPSASGIPESLPEPLTHEPSQVADEKGSSMEATAVTQSSGFEMKPEADTETKRESVRKKKRTLDPIRWYGILVPPSLRSAQKSFTEAVEASIPELASTVTEMRVAEKEILRLRKELGR